MSGRESREGNLDALERVMSTYETRLLRYAARIAGDATAAEDIVQETFIRLVAKWRGPLEPGPSLSSWLYRVAHNCAVDYVRRESRASLFHRQHAEDQISMADPELPDSDAPSEDALRAANALRSLSDRERQLVVLKVMEDKSYREIAEITGLSTGNVGYILHHAMKKLTAAAGPTGTES
jgi:RNA polymerase sigma-70 factor (ECF subfamily)